MDASAWLEYLFLGSSTTYIALQTFQIAPLLGLLYLAFVISAVVGFIKLRAVQGAMVFASPLGLFNAFIYLTLLLSKISSAQSPDVDTTSRPSGSLVGTATTTFRPIFTVPASADQGAVLIPNINDPNAVDAQTVCPGYVGSNVLRTPYGLTATLKLAGPACNVYGTDIETLNLTVEYQSSDRLSVNIQPAYIDASNSSYFILPSDLIYKPTVDANAGSSSLTNDLGFFWSNEPTFSFSVVRMSTGEILFSTYGTKVVYENQFIEFVSALPENYNLYGLGEVIHGLRLGNNLTRVRLPTHALVHLANYLLDIVRC